MNISIDYLMNFSPFELYTLIPQKFLRKHPKRFFHNEKSTNEAKKFNHQLPIMFQLKNLDHRWEKKKFTKSKIVSLPIYLKPTCRTTYYRNNVMNTPKLTKSTNFIILGKPRDLFCNSNAWFLLVSWFIVGRMMVHAEAKV